MAIYKKGPGRPKLDPELRLNYEKRITHACKRLSQDAVNLLGKALKDETLDMRTRITVAQIIMDRGLGKPKLNMDQKIDITVNGYGNALEAAQRRALARASGETLQRLTVEDTAVEVATRIHEEDEAQFTELNDGPESISPDR